MVVFWAWFAFVASVLLCADVYGMSTETGYTDIYYSTVRYCYLKNNKKE